MSSSTKGRLPPQVVVHRRLSSMKVVFHWRYSSTKGCIPLKVVFYQRSSSTRGHLPPKVVFHLRLSSTYHNTLIDFIFVRTVNIPNLSFLPCLEVASPLKVVFHPKLSLTYHDTLVDLIFVKTVNILILSLLPCLEVASPLKVVFHQRMSPTIKWDSKTRLRLVKKGAVRLVSEEVENWKEFNSQT